MPDNMKPIPVTEVETDENYGPWPANTNDRPFMTYEKLQTGAPGKAAK